MSVFKDQFSKALPIWATEDAVIPSPYVMCSGTNTSTDTNILIDENIDFNTYGVSVGDIVFNVNDRTYATITYINKNDDVHQLGLNVDLFASEGTDYIIYQQSAKSGLGNQGCNLYIGQSGDVGSLFVQTIGGDFVSFYGVKDGYILPVQVRRFLGGTVDKVIAFW